MKECAKDRRLFRVSTRGNRLGSGFAVFKGIMNTSLQSVGSVSRLFLLVLLSIVLGACSARRTRMMEGGVSLCQTPIQATLASATGSLQGIGVGAEVAWMVRASGCTGKFRIEYSGGTLDFTSAAPAIFRVTYPVAREYSETIEVVSIDGAGLVVGRVSISSDSFAVGGANFCSVLASSNQLNVPVNASNQMSAPVAIGFQLSHSTEFSLKQVLLNNVAVVGSALNRSLPTALANPQSVDVLIGAPGTQALRFQVQNAAGELGECKASVVLTPVVSTVPLITDFRATPMNATIGQVMSLDLQVSGAVTSADIDGSAVSLVNGMVSRPIVPTRTGLITAKATVVGPGGVSNRNLQFLVNPKCTIRPIAPPSAVPGPLSLLVDVSGDFVVGVVEGPNSAPATFTPPSGVLGGISGLPVTVQMNASPAPITLTVYGPNGSMGQCGGTAVYNAPILPVPTLSVNGSVASPLVPIEVPYLSSVTFTWSSTNATSCILNPGGYTGLSGTQTVAGLAKNTRFILTCTGPGGTGKTSAMINVPCPASTTYANKSIGSHDGNNDPANLVSSGLTPGWRLFATSISGEIDPWVGNSFGPSDCRTGLSQNYTDQGKLIPLVRFRDANGVISEHSLGELEAGVVIPAGTVRADGVYIDPDPASNSGSCDFTLVQKPVCAP